MKAIFIAFLFYLFILINPVYAVTVSISSFPPVISSDSFTVTASISGATAGTNYLKIDIFKDGTTNYFGETFNNLDWYSGSSYSQYLPITIQNSTAWSGSVQGRVGTPNSTDYDGQGTYKLRLRRYTGGGGYTSAEANSSAVTVIINLPTPTLSPTNTTTPQPTNTSIPTPTPFSVLTKIPTITVSKNISPTDILDIEVLAESTKSSGNKIENSKKNLQVNKPQKTDKTLMPKILIIVGIVFLLACVIVIAYPYIRVFRKEKING